MKKTFINISYTRKVRFRKKIHGQTSDHVWSFLNLFSKRPREKKEKITVLKFASAFEFITQAGQDERNKYAKQTIANR